MAKTRDRRAYAWLRSPLLATLAAGVVALGLAPTPAHAQGRDITFIRDAEIEATIAAYASPIFEAAGLDPDNVRVHIVRDSALNAFVAGGQQLFIHTGLLMRAGRPNQVIGVIAHEAGHIMGGDLVQLRDALAQATAKSIAALVLGTAAGIAAGSSDAAAAVIVGGQQVAGRQLLAYTQGQESAADAAALSLLDATGQSASGILEFFDVLAREQANTVGQRDPYTQTHPAIRDRRGTVAAHLALSRYADVPDPPDLRRRHDRMVAKLVAFIAGYDAVQSNYPAGDNGVAARYARSIALFRRGELEPALENIDSLLAEQPDDPFFHEIKGQMLFENGRIEAALPSYQRAVDLAPDAALIRVDLARVQLETNDPALLPAARDNLKLAVRQDPRLSGGWRALAVAHGRLNETGDMSLALAEFEFLTGRKDAAKAQAQRAEQVLPLGSPGWLRAQDLQRQLDR